MTDINKKKLEIIKKVQLIDTEVEIDKILQECSSSISRECDKENQEEKEFQKWKKEKKNSNGEGKQLSLPF